MTARRFIIFDLDKWEAAKRESPMDLEMAEFNAAVQRTPMTEDQFSWWLRESSGIIDHGFERQRVLRLLDAEVERSSAEWPLNRVAVLREAIRSGEVD